MESASGAKKEVTNGVFGTYYKRKNMEITRYTIDYKGLPFPDPDGEYVRYEEVKEFIEGAKNTKQLTERKEGEE